jgi:hypothetical protein
MSVGHRILRAGLPEQKAAPILLSYFLNVYRPHWIALSDL